MKKYLDKLKLDEGDIVTLVGAGGKSSTIFNLAQEIKNKKILITTTTQFMSFKKLDTIEIISNSFEEIIKKIKIIWKKNPKQKLVLGKSYCSTSSIVTGNKINGLPPRWIDYLIKAFPSAMILNEGDGAAMYSIKAPAIYEPVIPDSTTLLLIVMGMKTLGLKINKKNCFRLNEIKKLNFDNKKRVDNDLIVKILLDKTSYGAYLEKDYEFIPILNQVDKSNLNEVRQIAHQLLKKEKKIEKVILTDTYLEKPVLEFIC